MGDSIGGDKKVLLQVHKTLVNQASIYLHSKLTEDGNYSRDTRQARNSSIRLGPSYKTDLSLCKDSFRWRGAAWYEALPTHIRGTNQRNLRAPSE